MLQDSYYFETVIAANMQNSYYWSENWSEEFYVALAKKGFISTTYDTPEGLILLPELQYSYAVLDFENLHISQKVMKLLQKDEYIFSIDTKFDEVIEGFEKHHKYNWLKGEYLALMRKLYANKGEYENFELMSVELSCKTTGRLISAELGYKIGRTYTSLSGFTCREKAYNNYGTLQLVLLGKYLQKEGYAFWNLGHPHMEYKKKLGCDVVQRGEFLQRWNRHIEG